MPGNMVSFLIIEAYAYKSMKRHRGKQGVIFCKVLTKKGQRLLGADCSWRADLLGTNCLMEGIEGGVEIPEKFLRLQTRLSLSSDHFITDDVSLYAYYIIEVIV
jgi:hypothetical protein